MPVTRIDALGQLENDRNTGLQFENALVLSLAIFWVD